MTRRLPDRTTLLVAVNVAEEPRTLQAALDGLQVRQGHPTALFGSNGADPLFGPDEDRFDQSQPGGFDDAFQRHLIAGVSDRHFRRSLFLRGLDQPIQLLMRLATLGRLEFKHGQPPRRCCWPCRPAREFKS